MDNTGIALILMLIFLAWADSFGWRRRQGIRPLNVKPGRKPKGGVLTPISVQPSCKLPPKRDERISGNRERTTDAPVEPVYIRPSCRRDFDQTSPCWNCPWHGSDRYSGGLIPDYPHIEPTRKPNPLPKRTDANNMKTDSAGGFEKGEKQ